MESFSDRLMNLIVQPPTHISKPAQPGIKRREEMTLNTGSGGSPEYWGYPSSHYNYWTNSYDSGGLVWQGPKPATRADYASVQGTPMQNLTPDPLSICGTNDEAWSHWWRMVEDMPMYNQTYTA